MSCAHRAPTAGLGQQLPGGSSWWPHSFARALQLKVYITSVRTSASQSVGKALRAYTNQQAPLNAAAGKPNATGGWPWLERLPVPLNPFEKNAKNGDLGESNPRPLTDSFSVRGDSCETCCIAAENRTCAPKRES